MQEKKKLTEIYPPHSEDFRCSKNLTACARGNLIHKGSIKHKDFKQECLSSIPKHLKIQIYANHICKYAY